MYSESSIIAHVTGFLGEDYAALPVFKTDLETIITYSSAFAEIYSSTFDIFNTINQKTKMHYTKLIKEAEILNSLRAELELEKAVLYAEKVAWEAEKSQVQNMQAFESTVKLNVGGHKYSISLSTLRQYPDTMLGAMFSGRYTLISEADGSYFIDRDGTHFRHILNFLRSPNAFQAGLHLPPAVMKELRCECDYYGLLDLMFPFHFESMIQLNVGGHKHSIPLATLQEYSDTKLGDMFSGRHKMRPEHDR